MLLGVTFKINTRTHIHRQVHTHIGEEDKNERDVNMTHPHPCV